MKKSLILPVLLACLALAFSSFAAAEAVILPSETQVIESEAFRGCAELSGVLVIPDGVTEIGDYAFAGCTGLTGIPRIPDSVRRIGAHAFDGCTGLSGFLCLPKNANVDETAFAGCPGLTPTVADYRVAVVGDSSVPAGGTLDGDAWQAVSAWCADCGLPCAWYCGDIYAPLRYGYNVIVTVGFLQAADVPAAAEANPDARFICLDAEISSPADNVYASLYSMDQAGFMAGYAAVRMGYRSLGFMGGMETNDVVSCGQGFIRGANAAALEMGITDGVTVAYTYTGTFSAGPDVYAVADLWYKGGVEAIMSCGGGIIESIRQAAGENGGYLIGTDTDCSVNYSGTVTSAMKFVGVTAADALSRLVSGDWSQIGGTNPRLGVVGADPDANHVGVPALYSGGFTASIRSQMVNKLYTGALSTSGSVQIAVTSAPYISQIEAHQDGSVSVEWSAVPGATGYTLYYAEAGDEALTSGSRIPGITDTRIDLTGLNFKTDYLFAVAANIGDYETDMSPHVQARVRGRIYRSLLIGQEAFDPVCTRNWGDVQLMKGILTSRYTPLGTRFETPVTRKDRTGVQVLSDIDSAFAGADVDDVSIFFIATHGDTGDYDDDNEYWEGSLDCIGGTTSEEKWLRLDHLAEKLNDVPGKVVVILEACGSGAAVYDPGVAENASSGKRFLSEEAIISAFSGNELVEEEATVYCFDEEGNEMVLQGRTGDFRVADKFYVLCASRFLEMSWGSESSACNYFTRWLTDGVGTSGSIPADSNSNGIVTLNELFNYIKNTESGYTWYEYRKTDGTLVYYQSLQTREGMTYTGTSYKQHVQVYPNNSSFELFRR